MPSGSKWRQRQKIVAVRPGLGEVLGNRPRSSEIQNEHFATGDRTVECLAKLGSSRGTSQLVRQLKGEDLEP